MADEQKVKRAVRVAERVREELAGLIARTVRDPRVKGVSVARVDMTDDLRQARVLVRLLEGGDDEARREEALTGLTRAAGLFRREVTKRLSLRYAPELRFVYDDGQDHLSRIEQLLAEVEAEKTQKAPK
jgi:ribosome-binding factor A